MREFPGGLWYEPADLGFDDTLIGAGATVEGSIVPWTSRYAFSRVVLFWFKSGVSANFDVGIDSIDIDGSSLLAGSSSLWTGILIVRTQSLWGLDTPRPLNGAAPAAFQGLLGSPYVKFRVINQDGANPGNVTLKALLTKQ